MDFFYRRQWLLLTVVMGVLFIMFAHRAWQLRYLYIDPFVRADVQEALEQLSQEEGWLISDLSVLEANCNYQIKIKHRGHRKGKDDTECFYLNLRDSSRTACNAFL